MAVTRAHRRSPSPRISRGVPAGLLGLLLGALLAGCATSTPSGPGAVARPNPPPRETIPGLAGKLLLPRLGAWAVIDPATGKAKELSAVPSLEYPRDPSLSPDGRLIAFSLLRPVGTGVADLYVMGVDGSNPRLVLDHVEATTRLSEPAWSPDGKSLYYTRRVGFSSPSLERVGLDGAVPQVVVPNASSPAVSPDGRSLAYILTDPASGAQSLMVSKIDGSDPRRLTDGSGFLALASPRFGPSGELVFSGVPSGMSEALPEQPLVPPKAPWDPQVAYAHGVPWDLWLVRPDGSGLRRLTFLAEDTPVAAWSPDGRWLAMAGELGVYLVSADANRTLLLADEFSLGGLVWVP